MKSLWFKSVCFVVVLAGAIAVLVVADIEDQRAMQAAVATAR